MMKSRTFIPRGTKHDDVSAKNQQSDWSNEDKRASRTARTQRQFRADDNMSKQP